MNKYEITFSIHTTNKIIISLKKSLEYLDPLYREEIALLIDTKKIILSNATLYHNMIYLAENLKKALNHGLNLAPSITKDIGYSHNKYLYNAINISMPEISNDIEWVGYQYHLWSTRNDLISMDSWIYNDGDGSIVFEVTPIYPYLFSEPEEKQNYIPFEEWIKSYKPYFITTLSRERAEEWLKQAESIIKIVEDNQKKWDMQSKMDIES